MNGRSIVFVNRVYPPDHASTGQLLSELAEALVKRGLQVTVVVSHTVDSAPSRETLNGVRVVRLRGLPFTRASLIRRALSYLSLYPVFLWYLLRMPKADVLVLKTDPPLLLVLGVLVKLVRNVKVIHWAQDLYPEIAEGVGVLKPHGMLANTVRVISTWALKRHDRIVCVGRCMATHLRNRGIQDNRITVIPNWTDPEHVYPVKNKRNPFYKQYISDDRVVVMYSGNMGLAHPFEVILGAVEQMQDSHPDFFFIFVGGGPRETWVKKQVQKRRLDNIRMLPFQDRTELANSLSAGDIHLACMEDHLCGLVVPSKVMGVLAVARPCVFLGPADSEVARVIVEQQAGVVLANADAEELVSTLLRMKDADLRREMGLNGRAFAEREGLAVASGRFTKVLDSVLSG